MPLSFGTTPSQVSLFRHLADPKQVSQDKLREVKHKSNKKSRKASERQSYAPGRQSYAPGRQSYAPGAPGRQSYAPGAPGKQSYAPEKQSYAPGAPGKQSYAPGAPGKQSYAPRKQSYAPGRQNLVPLNEEEEEEEDAVQDNEENADHEEHQEENHEETSHIIPSASRESYESEKSQVQTLIDGEVEREKEHFLAELRKYRGQTTREFTMHDTLTDIQFEYDRLKSGENAANVVRIMGIVLQVIVYAVQWGNGKFGPLLKLDNGETSWAMQTAESISNRDYDNVLEKLYRKHWRKGSMSPEAELGMMLVGSAGVFHFQTHVNEKLSKRSASAGGSKGSGSGFNLMDLVGPVMGLMGGGGGGGNAKSELPFMSAQLQPPQPFNTASPPPKFDFVSGRSSNAPPPPPPPAVAPGPSLVEMEQQFSRRQQEMMNRMDEVTRRADEQMRASQARQLDLERQLQQTQMKLQHQTMQQHQMQAFYQQQHQQQQQQQQQAQVSTLQQPASRHLVQQLAASRYQPPQQTQVPPRSVRLLPPEPELTIVEEQSPPASPALQPSSEESGDEPEAETKFDVKEVMVTERQKRKKAPVQLEIDELSIAL